MDQSPQGAVEPYSAALSAYAPQDRRRAAAAGATLPQRAHGALLFVDISGFTPLTERLARELGLRRGADLLTRLLNEVYAGLIAEVDAEEGSVIGFSGDAFTAWFAALDGEPGMRRAATRALAVARGVQQRMGKYLEVEVVEGLRASLAVKCALAAGTVVRRLVGDPNLQLLDLIAGSPPDKMAAAEQLAQPGEIVADREFLRALGPAAPVLETRGGDYGVLDGSANTQSGPEPANPPDLPELPNAERWLQAPVAAAIRSGHERFLAELRPAVALFVRFAGTDWNGDAQAADALDEWLRQAQQAIASEEGTLIQLTTGDKGTYCYAAFGAPVAHEDDVPRAVRVALALTHSALSAGSSTKVCCGVSKGLMRVGAYGGPSRRTYGVLGAEVNRAARLMMHAAPGQVLVTQTVADELQEKSHAVFGLRELGPVALKGAGETTVFAIEWATGVESVFLLPASRSQPLIGREIELATLRAGWNQAPAGAVLVVEGAAGIGKSRLVAESTRLAAEDGLRVLQTACTSVTQNSPFSALRPLLTGLLDPDSGTQPGARLLESAGREEPGWAERLPLLGEVIGESVVETPLTAALDAKARLQVLSSLFVEIARKRAAQTRYLIVVEDAHWLDESSHAVLSALAEETAELPVVLLLVSRPSPTGRQLLDEARRRRTHLKLVELGEGGSTALLEQRLGGAVAPLLADVVLALAQGNPFYLEELVETLLDTARLERVEGVWSLSDSTLRALRAAQCLTEGEMPRLRLDAALGETDLGLPQSVQGLVLARLDRLPELARLALKVASVFGHSFELPLLAEAPILRAAGSADELRDAIDIALERDFVRPSADRYAFKHSITREVTYGTLLEEQQQELHLAVAEVLERHRVDAIDELAHHFARADAARPGVRTRALHYLDAAATRAARDYANETALVWLEQALRLEVRPSLLRTRIQVLHVLARRDAQLEALQLLAALGTSSAGDALLWSDYFEAIGDFTSAGSHLDRALEETDTSAATAAVLVRLGMILWRQGDYTGAEDRFTAALAVLQEAPASGQERADAHYGLGLAARQLGRLDDANQHFEQDLQLNRELGNRVREARALTALGTVASLRRAFHSALHWFEQALEIRRAIGDKAGVGAGLLTLAQTRGSLGDHAAALPLLQEALRVQQAIHNRWEECLIWNELGIVRMLLGEYPAAAEALERGLAGAHAIGSEIGVAYLTCNLGQVQRDAGDLALAEQTLRTGLALAVEQEDVGLEAIYRGDLALTLLYANRFDEARSMAEAAIRLHEELDQQPPLTAIYATLSQAALGLGEPEAALLHARAATRILDQSAGEGVDFPQRDYWMCAHVLDACGAGDEASAARRAAYRFLNEKAERISDPALRQAYLQNSTLHRAILSQP